LVPDGASSTAAPQLTVSAAATPPDWPTYHANGERTGLVTGLPTLGRGLGQAWAAALDGAVYGEPLGVGGRVIVATENDSVYALDPTNGHVVWRRHLGTPVPLAALPCGDIDPLGITSTPVYDRTSGSLFVVAETSGPHHVLVALDASTGAVRWSRGVDLPGDDPTTHQQRAALALGNGYVYIGFGGLDGDCGAYRGEVVGVPVSGHGATIAYRVPVAREGGVWATGGPLLDTSGNLYVSVGNGSSTTTYDGSDSVLELSPTLHLRSRFAPTRWAHDNANDLDLGSLSPVLVPGGFVFITGKSGTGYVLRQGALGGVGGQVSSTSVCTAFGSAAQSGSTIYLPCSDGLRMVVIGTSGAIHVGWHTSSGASGPPVIGGGAVWSLDIGAGVLLALSPSSGAVLARIGVGPLPHFASPTLWDGLVLVGTMHGVRAIRSHA
ncbi:MAG TPA: PQQ-binding-like beta-propeller repeat protein, partial [Acidimicrobiales bacterium]|nr:PQQ-binding-like beta-propeller repeat protein [Acidimicrobiales bacterium]